MDEKRYKNLYDALCSHVEFSNFVESYGLDEVDLTKINYDLLNTIFAGFYFTTTLDPFIEKQPNGDVQINLHANLLNNLADNLGINNGKGYTIGELSYKNSTVLLDKVRNKLAHGDFIVEEGNIIFEENNHKGIIPISKLLGVVSIMDTELRHYKLKGKESIMNLNLKYVANKKVHGMPSFKKFCKDFIIVTIEDEPKEGYIRTGQYIHFVKKMRERMSEIFKVTELDDRKIKEYIEINQPYLDLLGINLTYRIETVDQTKDFKYVTEDYEVNMEYLNQLDSGHLGRYIANKVLKLSKGQFQSFNYKKGIMLILCLLKTFKEHPEYTMNDFLKNNPEINFTSFLEIDNAIIATDLVGFTSFYQYGLEKGLTKKGSYDLSQLVTGKSLDFSQLELDTLDDPNMLIEHNFESYNDDIQKYENKNPIIEKRIDGNHQALESYLEHTKEEDRKKERISRLAENLDSACNDYKKNIILIDNMKKFQTTFDLTKYVRNINIVEHIRNAISHGTIYVDETESGKDILEKTILIKDMHQGVLTYEKKITVNEFADLFKMKNAYQLYFFIINNIENKELIDDTFLQRLNERINKRKTNKKM